MDILIAYATTEGQTEKIARFCADRLAARRVRQRPPCRRLPREQR